MMRSIGVMLANVSALAILALARSQAQVPSQNASDASTRGPDSGDLGEIVVTARKRQERELDVPTSMAVISTQDLDRLGIISLEGVAHAVPGLKIGPSVASFGGVASLRGIGATNNDLLTDQAVSFTMDGVTLSNGQAMEFGLFDIGRIEVLKGPQSLYYGKNTTAGVISITSNEPTDKFEAGGTLGYEFRGDGRHVEAFISGPITEGLTARVAYYHYNQNGLFDIASTEGDPGYIGTIGPRTAEHPDEYNENGGRFTVIANPTDQLTLNLKATLFRKSGPSTTMMEQLFGCPLGRPNPSNPGIQPAPQFQDCNVNKVVGPEAIEPAVTVSEFSYLPLIGQWGGRHLFFTDQYLGDFKADYAFSDGLALHSITSYYNLDQGDYGPGIPSSMNIIPELERTLTWDFTQEVRLESDFSTPFNFMVGGLYQRAGLDQRLNVLFPNLLVSLPPGHFVSPGAYLAQQEETRSGFGQITYDILSNLKLLAGGRYTSEGKSLVATSATTGAYLPNALPNLDFTNFSPDVTLTWSATPKTNVFASYREGAKSGGYSTSSYATSVTASDSYRNEIAKGFEGGIKRSMLDGHLYFEAIAYTYKYDNLQVSFFNANSLAFATSSVGSARSYGAELSATYRPPAIEGVTISGNVNYNHLRYLAGAAGQCYTGQSIAEGCRVDIVDGGYTAQDLAGLTPDRSADWTGSLTLGYQRPITAALDIGITVGANYSSAFNPDPAQDPLARQAGYALINSEVRLATHDDKYEVALIGNNLCDVIRIQNAYELPFTGNAAATGTATAGQLSDKFGFANQPMTLELRFRARF